MAAYGLLRYRRNYDSIMFFKLQTSYDSSVVIRRRTLIIQATEVVPGRQARR